MGAQAVRLSNVDINTALENKDFEVLFQPIFDLGNGGLARLETFVRWHHPTLGILPPGAFISFFESQGRMSELTRYVLDMALDSYAGWRGPYAPGFSINLALTDLSDEAFGPHLVKVLRDRDFPADLVTLECPMPPVDADMDAATANFARLRETGARLAIEVRGRANDFLKTIDPFPFDEIKTGGSAILRFARTVRGPGLTAISDLLDIASKKKAIITAVGVEDQASLSALRGLGFTAAQGNHLAKVGAIKDFRPARVNEVRELLELEPLGSDDLSAMFRTQAPTPKAATSTDATDTKADGHIVERLNARVAEEQKAAKATALTESEKSAEDEAAHKAEVKERARKKAKALALAKRAKARDARKAAAIKRAKAKAALSQEDAQATTQSNQTEPDETAFPPSAAPRDLQDRLAKEFDDYAAEEDEINAELSSSDTIDDDTAQSDIPVEDVHATEIDSALDEVSSDTDIAETAATVAESDHTDNEAASVEMQQQKPAKASEEQQFNFNNIDLHGGGYKPTKNPEPDQHRAPQNDPRLSLPIGNAAAFFRPGIRVSGTPASINENFMGAQDADAQTDNVIEEVAAPNHAENTQPNPIPEQTDIDQGTLYSGEEDTTDPATPSEEAAEYESSAPRRKRKNFLTRKYKVVPTHFWPRSWRRMMRQTANKA